MAPEVGRVEVAIEETAVVPGWGREGGEETENYDHKDLSLSHVEQEH